MNTLNVTQASAYACTRLAQELSPKLVYHSLAHTRDDVVPAVERLAVLNSVSGEDVLLLRTAAWYHDLGFLEQRSEHELVSARIAAQVLPHFGYSETQSALITGMILATRLPQTPHTLLEHIMVDADLDSLGRQDFLTWSLALRAELAAFDMPTSLAEWYSQQLTFLQNHQYFTAAARTLREAQKQKNMITLTKLLAACRDSPAPLP